MNKLNEAVKSKKGYQIELEDFSGPLELLLNLIKTQEIDIYNIPIARITGQYLEYVNLMEELDLDMAGEFLVMAATLIYIKSKMLLPKDEFSTEAENDEDPRAELVEALMEYKRYKKAADHLGELAGRRQQIFHREEIVSLKDDVIEADLFTLITAFRKILDEIGKNSFAEIRRSPVTVKEKIVALLEIVKQKKEFDFGEIFNKVATRLEAVVCFLAVLELIRQKKIIIKQNTAFGEIKILRREPWI